jgi:hypothetical protein
VFYVYVHKRADTNQVFYVGKGKGKRAFQVARKSSDWKRVVSSYGYRAEFLVSGIDEEFAFFAEQEAIDVYRKRGAPLTNITDGGRGVKGLKHKEETKRLISTKSAENNPRYWLGKKMSDTHRQKLSESHKGKLQTEEQRRKTSETLRANPHKNKKPVICTNTGVEYPSATRAAEILGVKRRTLAAMLSGQSPNRTTLIYKEI